MSGINPTGIWTTSREGNVYVTILKDDVISVLENVSKKIAAAAIESIQSSGTLDASKTKIRSFPVADIQSAETAQTGEFVKIKYREEGKDKNFSILMEQYSDREQLMNALAGSSGAPFTKTEEPLSLPMAIIGPGALAAGAVVVTGIFLMALSDPEGGEDYQGTGRGSGMKKLLARVVLALGPAGIIGIGSLVLVAALIWMYFRIKNPPLKTILKRTA